MILSAPFPAGEAKRNAPCSRPRACPSSTSAARRSRNLPALSKQSLRCAVDSDTLLEPLFECHQVVQQIGPPANHLRRDPWNAIGVALPRKDTPFPIKWWTIARVGTEVAGYLVANPSGRWHVDAVRHLAGMFRLCVKSNWEGIWIPAGPRCPSVVLDEEPVPRPNDARKDSGDQPMFFLEAEFTLIHDAIRSSSRRSRFFSDLRFPSA